MKGISVSDGDKRLLKQLDLNRFVQEHLDMKPRGRSGGITYYFSPLRKETRPSFAIECYHGEWRWRDWGGDDEDRGDIIELVERVHRVKFPEAVRILLSHEYPAAYYEREAETEKRDREAKTAYARWLYTKLLKVNNVDTVAAYFRERGVAYHFPIGSALYNDFKEKKVYIATPAPTPWDLTALECREIKGDAKKTLGAGSLWFFERDSKKILITESILDCLAGEVLLDDREMSLCALNSASYVNQLTDFLEEHNPDEVWLATDNDKAGMKARDKAIEMISRTRTQIVLVEDHFRAGVKDLHGLLAANS
ncbi:MAG: DNA primase [Syntrophorhabdus sp. PtaB.Bin184]|nr:MAG: DNA primase [Syntrophorhabdus sp. PtaB.Bin184]